MEIKVDLIGGLKRTFDVPECDGNSWNNRDREMSQPFSAEEIKVFYYWYEFLRRSPRSKWTKIVREDFQSMVDSESAAMMEFDEWWFRYNHLFRRTRFVDVEVSTLEKAGYFIEDGEQEPAFHLLLMDVNWPKARLMKRLSEIVDALPKGHIVKGRYQYSPDYPQGVEPSGGSGGYGIYAEPGRRSRPKVQLLRNALEVYDVYCKWENGEFGRMTKYQIQSYISKTREHGEELVDRGWNDKGEATKESSPEVDGVTVARFKNCADLMIENVCKGIFPKYLK